MLLGGEGYFRQREQHGPRPNPRINECIQGTQGRQGPDHKGVCELWSLSFILRIRGCH